VATTVEELPAGFWDDDEPIAAPRAIDEAHGAEPDVAPTPRPAPARPTPPPPAPRAVAQAGAPPALASLQGLALLQAVFPGRVVKVERAAPTEDDAAPEEPPIAGTIDPSDDDPDPGADAPPPPTP
jgi:hypothetical protein